MSKPTGAVCNLDCEYCFFLSKDQLYPGSGFRMEPTVHEAYIRQLLEAHEGADEVVFLHRGRVAERSPAALFFEAPASAEAGAFLEGRLVL